MVRSRGKKKNASLAPITTPFSIASLSASLAAANRPQGMRWHPAPNDCYPLNKLCRLCLLSNSNMEPIFAYPGDISLSQRIFQCTNLEVHENEDDGMPSSICSQCKRQIDQCHEFRLLCWKNNEVLQNLHAILSPRMPSSRPASAIPFVQLQKLAISPSVLQQRGAPKNINSMRKSDVIPLSHLYTPSKYGHKSKVLKKSLFSRELVVRLAPISPALLKKYKKATAKKKQTKASVKSYEEPAKKSSKKVPTLKISLKPPKPAKPGRPKSDKPKAAKTTNQGRGRPKGSSNKKPKPKRAETAVPLKKRKQKLEQSAAGTSAAIVACTLCTQTFSNKKNLSRHMATHENNRKQSRVFNCDICKKEYLKAGQFTEHLRSAEHIRNAGWSAPDVDADVSILPDESQSSSSPVPAEDIAQTEEPPEPAADVADDSIEDEPEQELAAADESVDDSSQILPDTNDLCEQLVAIGCADDSSEFVDRPPNQISIPVDSDTSSQGDGVQYSEVCSTNNAEALFNKLKGDARPDTRRVSFAEVTEILD